MICPLEPIPQEWEDGRELKVESAVSEANEDRDFETWYRELQTVVAHNDPTDLAIIDSAIRIADEEAKAIVRKQMGL